MTLTTPHNNGLGYLPDAPDQRDRFYHGGGELKRVRAFVDLRGTGFLPGVWDQGQLGSCTAHGALAAFLFAAAKAGVSDPMLSRLMVYYRARQLEGTTDLDAGAQIRDAIKACAAGVAPETDWPYEISRYAEAPPTQADLDAIENRATEYLSVGRWGPAIQACLEDGYPVVIGVRLYSSFEGDQAWSTGVVPYPEPGESEVGGHCMLVVGAGYGWEWATHGFATDGFPDAIAGRRYALVRNSWGADAYVGGHLLLPMPYLHRHGNDFWTIRQAT